MTLPICSICSSPMKVISQTVGVLYEGVACTSCKRVTCLKCNGPQTRIKQCIRCGGEVRPALADVIQSIS